MTSKYIIEVSESEFQHEVLAYSSQIPVIVDFWAEWCIPCRTLAPILEKLVEEAQGAFRLAKVNVDENPRLAQKYKISSIPAVKAFHGGEVINEFIGIRPEPEVREFLGSLAPSANDLVVEKGYSLYLEKQWEAAAEAFRQALGSDPDHGQALLGLAKSELAQGNAAAALVVLREFPSNKQYTVAQRLLPLAEIMANLALGELVESADEFLESAYENSLRLIGRGNLPSAIDGLLEILRSDIKFRTGEIQNAILGALEMLDQENAQVRDYRSELSSLLF